MRGRKTKNVLRLCPCDVHRMTTLGKSLSNWELSCTERSVSWTVL